MIEDSEYIRRLKAAIGCPCDWACFDPDPLFKRTLLYYWQEISKGHQVDDEASYYNQLHAILMKDEDELKVIEINSRTWREAAVREYLERTEFFRNFRHLSEMEHSKHWMISKVSKEQHAKMTKSAPAKYVYQYPISKLSMALYDAVRFNWRPIAEERPLHLYVRFQRDIGMSRGQLASCVRFDLEYSTGNVHSHPILISEKPTAENWLDDYDLDEWPGLDLQYGLDSPTVDEPLECLSTEDD